MTEKKELILQTALRLFSEQGYEATPTNRIAKEAGVSEGLIFRHFENKEGLLSAILALGEIRILPHVQPILSEKKPLKILEKLIDLPAQIVAAEPEFWTLQARLKWLQRQNGTYQPPQYYLDIFAKAVEAFTALDYKKPNAEAQILMLTLDGLGQSMMMQSIDNQSIMKNDPNTEGVISLLKKKYKKQK
jgi:AcrR family transcriptional regulator